MSRITRGWEALQAQLTQSIETVTRTSRLNVHSSDVDEIDLAENVAEYYDIFETTPFIRASITNFASDVVGPGVRVEGDDDQAVDYLMDTWLPQAAIIAGEKHKDIHPFLYLTVIQRWARGGGLIEHVRPDSESEEITGVNHIKPETVEARTQANKNILISPDETGTDVETTPRNEAAAYVQFDDNAVLGPFADKKEIPLSQNDVTRTLLDPDIGDLWGTPVTETVNADVTGFKNILRDQERAIKTKAYGLWSIAFGRDTIEGPDFFEIVEWSDDDQDDFVDELDDMGPGEIVTHDGTIELDKFEPDVPDLIEQLEFYVSEITSALPSPKYVVGFEKNINQFVTEAQDERYEHLIEQERKTLERDLTPLLKQVIENNTDFSSEGLELTIEPEEDSSPIRSLDNDDVDRIKEYADAVSSLYGPGGAPSFIDDETILTEILQLPEEALPDNVDELQLDEGGEQVQDQFEQSMGDGE